MSVSVAMIISAVVAVSLTVVSSRIAPAVDTSIHVRVAMLRQKRRAVLDIPVFLVFVGVIVTVMATTITTIGGGQ
jgi:hypothetical protein